MVRNEMHNLQTRNLHNLKTRKKLKTYIKIRTETSKNENPKSLQRKTMLNPLDTSEICCII